MHPKKNTHKNVPIGTNKEIIEPKELAVLELGVQEVPQEV
jgi:hypothetical protein